MSRRFIFLCLAVSIFSSLAVASGHSIYIHSIMRATNFTAIVPNPEVGSLALFGTALFFAARWLRGEENDETR